MASPLDLEHRELAQPAKENKEDEPAEVFAERGSSTPNQGDQYKQSPFQIDGYERSGDVCNDHFESVSFPPNASSAEAKTHQSGLFVADPNDFSSMLNDDLTEYVPPVLRVLFNSDPFVQPFSFEETPLLSDDDYATRDGAVNNTEASWKSTELAGQSFPNGSIIDVENQVIDSNCVVNDSVSNDYNLDTYDSESLYGEMMESGSGVGIEHEVKRRRVGNNNTWLNCDSTSILKEWYRLNNPHPSPQERANLISATGLTDKQVVKWFNNERARQKRAAGKMTNPNKKFSKSAVDFLLKWYAEHELNPYPNRNEKDELSLDTGMTLTQIEHWFEHERIRRKKACGGNVRGVRGSFPEWVVAHLKNWFSEHQAHPYPTMKEKQYLSSNTGLTETQVGNWFKNERARQKKVA